MSKSIRGLWQNWSRRRLTRSKYGTFDRAPFFEIVRAYLPDDREAIVVDLGAGEGAFADQLDLARYANMKLLDGNPQTVSKLRQRFGESVIQIKLPSRLPFEDGSVAFLHCSHLIEHFEPREALEVLREIDRVLQPGTGCLVVSTPLLNEGGFYDDLTHIRPYSLSSLLDYLGNDNPNRTATPVAGTYKLVYHQNRYCSMPVGGDLGSDLTIIDLLLWIGGRVCSALKIKHYTISGYTAVFRKLS
jgi:ubiquinone/menaquinone biosynthesis C-methylase UbiE